jgi:hypothetical protein
MFGVIFRFSRISSPKRRKKRNQTRLGGFWKRNGAGNVRWIPLRFRFFLETSRAKLPCDLRSDSFLSDGNGSEGDSFYMEQFSLIWNGGLVRLSWDWSLDYVFWVIHIESLILCICKQDKLEWKACHSCRTSPSLDLWREDSMVQFRYGLVRQYGQMKICKTQPRMPCKQHAGQWQKWAVEQMLSKCSSFNVDISILTIDKIH